MKIVVLTLALVAIVSGQNLRSHKNSPNESFGGFNPVIGALQQFYTGIFQGLNAGSLVDVMSCYTTTSGALEMEFYYEWVMNVAKANVSTAQNATWFYFNSTGANIYLEIPTYVLNCVHNSQDYATLVKAAGIDLDLTIVFDAFEAYLTNNTQTYYNQFSTMFSQFNSLNATGAGQTYAAFIQNVAQIAIEMENSDYQKDDGFESSHASKFSVLSQE
jgi:hypothetical protein